MKLTDGHLKMQVPTLFNLPEKKEKENAQTPKIFHSMPKLVNMLIIVAQRAKILLNSKDKTLSQTKLFAQQSERFIRSFRQT